MRATDGTQHGLVGEGLAALTLSAEELAAVEALVKSTATTAPEVNRAAQVLAEFSGSVTAARALVAEHPALLAQVQHVLCQTPEALVRGDLLAAGRSILTFRRMGLDDAAAAQLVTYYPQLLCKEEAEIRQVVDMLGRYQTGVDALSC
ncbi:hypothetical protein TSOC_007328 [Tetrabaena socialis]|uniref:Uncharacterized protein n=1 Tax=Tetrabaena socialis TaxID=47790 RepID=A0A2J8A1B5_9CHLO|nr:hypothetical protein TSOC_007328 [Tetrabaena socialis]|eukprot:PNH06311.1 hypothetical protein TSOC_007328 [Tetrabaena socialis]